MLQKIGKLFRKPFRKVALKRARKKRNSRFESRLIRNRWRVELWKDALEKAEKESVNLQPEMIRTGLRIFRDYDKQLESLLKKMEPSADRAIVEEDKKKLKKYIEILEEKKKK